MRTSVCFQGKSMQLQAEATAAAEEDGAEQDNTSWRNVL